MKKLLLVSLSTCSLAGAQTAGVVDLTALDNYANQAIPAYVTKDNTTPGNAVTDLGATLGRVLFYDRRLSQNNTVSCSSCHQQEHAFGDLNDASIGVAGTTGRHSMRLVNARFAREARFFWDERAATLEDQTSQPIQDHVEMGFSGQNGDPDFSDLVTKLEAIEEYQVLFTGVFGDSSVTESRVQDALSQFVRSIQSFDSRYDIGRSAVGNNGAPFPNFTAQENLGKQLFLSPPPMGGAGCAGCHQPPEFDIDPNSGHNGVTTSLNLAQDLTNTRSPSLRDLVDSNGSPHGGFMHDASIATLRGVINHYDAIPAVTAGLDRRLQTPPGPGMPAMPQSLGLTNPEKNALVAFLETLTGENVYTDQRWSDPFTEQGDLELIVLPTSTEVAADGTNITISAPAVPNVTYLLRSSDDLINWTNGTPVVASINGQLSETVPMTGTERFYSYFYIPTQTIQQ